jgi:inorganic pyrophosphatase
MNLDRVASGDNIPNEINVVVEIPAQSDPVKYELDKDGDPVDVMVVTTYPLIPGSVIKCRPVGVLKMTDESGDDAKILAVPTDSVSRHYHSILDHHDLPEILLDQVAHFFEHYKDLDEGKWVRVGGWGGADEARDEIMASVAMYKDAPVKPNF